MYNGPQTFGAIVAQRAEQQPDRVFARFESDSLTYEAWHRAGNRAAAMMAGLGLRKGDTAAVMLPNGSDYLTTWLGLARLGVVEVPINTAYKGDLFAYLLTQAECRVVVVHEQWRDRVDEIRHLCPQLEHVIVVGPSGDLAARLADASEREISVPMNPADPSVVLFTSGTTGPSKGAILSHRANFRLSQMTVELMGYGKDERLFSVFPLFHVNARYTTVLAAMYVDGDVVMHDRFSATHFWDLCRAENVTAFNYMGALLMMLMKQPERDDDAANPVRRAYGAPAPLEIYDDFERRFGVQLVEVYGSTELGTATINTVDSFVKGSCGKAVPYYDVRIHDELDNECPPDVEGEIVVRPKEPSVMFDGYFGNAQATVEAWRNLWFHTGDRARRDADGYFYFVDRMKDAVRRRGENISSFEVEKVINDHPQVFEAAVIGVPSELTEEEVLAIIICQPGETIDPVELLDHCAARMAHFAVPRYVRFVADLPRTPSQRVEKYKLRAEGLTADTWDRESAGYRVGR